MTVWCIFHKGFELESTVVTLVEIFSSREKAEDYAAENKLKNCFIDETEVL